MIALSGLGLSAGRRAQQLGGAYICDRGSSHICFQNEILKEEYRRYHSEWIGIDSRILAKEEEEYEQANWISIPSQFCLDSFIAIGVPRHKLKKIPYGARLGRFSIDVSRSLIYPQNRTHEFRVLFVGQAGVRKGFVDLLKAFRLFKHPCRRLTLIGSISTEAKELLDHFPLDNVEIVGIIPNDKLRQYYNKSSVFLLPSVEEGLAMVMGEAMACGLPVIATANTGADDLFTNGQEGFIVPIRSPEIIADCLQNLADDPELRSRMAIAASARIDQMGGWDKYGSCWRDFLFENFGQQIFS